MSVNKMTLIKHATIAQLVECYLGKVEVTGSIPVSSSKKYIIETLVSIVYTMKSLIKEKIIILDFLL